MTDPSLVPLLISLCGAVAAAGAFGVHARRLKLEGAALVVTSARVLPDGRVAIRLLNVGGRPAFDIEASASRLKPDVFVEGIEAGGERELTLDATSSSKEIVISYDDLQAGRREDARSMALHQSTVELGLKRSSKGIRAAPKHNIPHDPKREDGVIEGA